MNPYALRRQILSLVRLPISPPRPLKATAVAHPCMAPLATGRNRRVLARHPILPQPPSVLHGRYLLQTTHPLAYFRPASPGRAGRSLCAKLAFS